MHSGYTPTALPYLEIISTTGAPDVAEIFVARTRRGDDDSMIEFVNGLDWRHPREEKWIINVSTQFGCPVGCVFCDAAHRFFGNLAADEMLAQVRAVLDRHPGLATRCAKLKVHFARMGEPALNPHVLTAMSCLPGMVQSPGLWACVATTAPRGTEAWFERLLEVRDKHFPRRFQLQFSVNSTSEPHRAALVPVALQPFEWIREYAARFHEPGGRMVVLNFALSDKIPFDADALDRHFDPATTCVKLTPLNPTDAGRDNLLESMSRDRLEQACAEVRAQGFRTVLSIGDPREDEIGSNCGQSVRRMRVAG